MHNKPPTPTLIPFTSLPPLIPPASNVLPLMSDINENKRENACQQREFDVSLQQKGGGRHTLFPENRSRASEIDGHMSNMSNNIVYFLIVVHFGPRCPAGRSSANRHICTSIFECRSLGRLRAAVMILLNVTGSEIIRISASMARPAILLWGHRVMGFSSCRLCSSWEGKVFPHCLFICKGTRPYTEVSGCHYQGLVAHRNNCGKLCD